ncbi:conserved phage C-terminal domain-containing protein [Shouchella lehensis]|uniref:Replication protein n=1 Tax=Shouchella lehensis TaxID=300825 RepID=A0A4Y7WII7_9BACI|nr:conserved phage C-terminal domain-containing protein [Shouchella lehensis]MBG9785603.1 replication protein [Shouchella lehensis]TES48054.1 replication protein [Shouchella lehensis]
MAKYRNVHIDFWQDGFVLDLTPEEKYFYLYLMTNSKTTQCGIYELPYRIMETETGYTRETVEKYIDRFEEYGKVSYNKGTKEVILLNWVKYNFINSPKVISRIRKELEVVKHQPFLEMYKAQLIRYGYPIDTLCIDIEKEKEKENDKEKEKIPYDDIISYLNEVASKNYRSTTSKTKDLIKARWNDGFKLGDFKRVIHIKTKEWLNDPEMNQYLRPETLFGNKFEGYLNQREVKHDSGNSKGNKPSDGAEYDELSL